MPRQSSNTFEIEIDGSPLPADAELVSAVVDDSLNLPDLFVLTFRDPGRMVLQKTGVQIGKQVRISLTSPGSPVGDLLISGEVTALEAEWDPGGTRTIVRGFDHSHRLFRGRVTKTYVGEPASEIAKKVAERVGLPTGRIDATPSPSDPKRQTGQANESDWQFLRRLAVAADREVAVVDGKLDFRSSTSASDGPSPQEDVSSEAPLELKFGQNLLCFRVGVTAAEQVPEVQVRGWDPTRKEAVVDTVTAATTSAKVSVDPLDLARMFKSPSHVVVDHAYDTMAAVHAVATATAERIAGTFSSFDGCAIGNPRLKAGTAISLALLGDPFDGQYVLTTSRHVYDPNEGYKTWFTVSGRQERSLLGLSSGAPGPGSRIPGVVIALVNNTHDPADLGRVQLRFPWLSDDYVSDWARVMQLGAGKDRGSVFIPEPDDEVLVAFEQGDVNRPIVIGGLHNGKDTMPRAGEVVDKSTGAIKARCIVSRNGHFLTLSDDPNDEGVSLFSEDRKLGFGASVDKREVRVLSSDQIMITADGRITVKGGGDVEVEAGGSLKLHARQGVSIEGGMGNVVIKGLQIQLNPPG